MPVATMTSKGQITVPKSVRERLHLFVGERIDFKVDEEAGTVLLVPINKKLDDACGMLRKYAPAKAIAVEEMDARLTDALRKEHHAGD